MKNALGQYSGSDRRQAGIDEAEAVAVLLEKYEVAKAMYHGFDYARGLAGHSACTPRCVVPGLPLIDVHHRILLSVRGLDSRWVFPSYAKSGHIECWNHRNVPCSLHSLRHTFATVGVEAGVPEKVIGRLLNHSSKTITSQCYVKPKLAFLRTAIQVVMEELEWRMQVGQPV